MKKAFLSSTFSDLEEYRRRAEKVCKMSNVDTIQMEYWGAVPCEPEKHCMQKIEEADLYIGIFAHRYGDCPPGGCKSFTELEYEQAVLLNKPRLCFVADKDAVWPPSLMDLDRTFIECLKDRVKDDFICDTFASLDDFSLRLANALGNWLDAERKTIDAQSRGIVNVTCVINLNVSENVACQPVSIRESHNELEVRNAIREALPDGEPLTNRLRGLLDRKIVRSHISRSVDGKSMGELLLCLFSDPNVIAMLLDDSTSEIPDDNDRAIERSEKTHDELTSKARDADE